MKQSKFSIINIHDPKKTAAIFIFVLAFLAFMWEIANFFSTNGQSKIISKTEQLGNHQNQITSQSPLFTTALFGDYVPVNLSEAEIKQSLLDVKVVGIMYGEGNTSQVVLKIGGGQEESFVVGSTLPGGAIIKRITSENVVILHNGGLESLSLPKNELIFDVPEKPLIKE